MSSRWSETELDILDALTRRVRLLAERQIAAIWTSHLGTSDDLQAALNQLITAGLLHRTMLNAHPSLEIRSPLVAWRPGGPAPNVTRIAARIRNRWCQSAEPTRVYWASRKAANLLGSSMQELSTLLHRDHDLLLGEVYVFYRRRRPRLAGRWLGESVFPKAGFQIKDPDAFLFGDDGRPLRVIESVREHASDPRWAPLIKANQFEITIATTFPQKAERLCRPLNELAQPSPLPIRVTAIADLLYGPYDRGHGLRLDLGARGYPGRGNRVTDNTLAGCNPASISSRTIKSWNRS
jgi:hypothetical protein